MRLKVTPQRTADKRFVAPTPMIDPVIVWVVLTGIFSASVTNKVIAPAVSAATPSNGSYFGDLGTHRFYNFPSPTHGSQYQWPQ